MTTKILTFRFTYSVPVEVSKSVKPNNIEEDSDLYRHALNLLQVQRCKPTFDVK